MAVNYILMTLEYAHSFIDKLYIQFTLDLCIKKSNIGEPFGCAFL